MGTSHLAPLRPALCALTLLLAANLALPATIGPIDPDPITTLYLVADDTPATVRIIIDALEDAEPPRMMLRAYDPAEQPTLWRYVEYVPASTLAAIHPPEGVTLADREAWDGAPQRVLEAELALEQPGVHQVRLVDWTDGLVMSVEVPDGMPWGWSAQNGAFRAWEGGPREMYAWVPPHAEQLRIKGGPVTVRDGGEVLAEADSDVTTIPVRETEVVWRFQLADTTRMYAADFPLILCPTPGAAEAIEASVIVLEDGTVVCHEFQRRIARLLPEVIARTGDTEALITPLATRRDQWLADPMRNSVLMESYLPTIEHWLRSQNLDPQSHWSGSLEGWQERIDRPAPENRWDRLRGIDGLYAGASTHYGSGARDLALAALRDDPPNVYYGREELLYRAAAAALRDLMVVGEDEIWPGVASFDPYPGMMPFALGQKTLPVYGLVAPQMPEEIRDVWTDAVRRLVERSYADDLVTCRNQSSHNLVVFQAFANGSGDDTWRELTRLYARRWMDGQDPSGYHMERIGPDASYIGMTHWHEAVFYEMGGDPAILDSVRRSYELFNHTVGPEPDGRMLGGFNFNHRVAEGFYGEQWSGARGILHDDLPEVGIWADPPPTEEDIARARERIEAFLADPQMPRYPSITTWRYLAWAEPDRSGRFPCEEEPFWRVYDDEWLFVKRETYYTYLYLGKPAEEYYVADRVDFREPYPDDGESTGADLAGMKRITPFVGGGLSGFWTGDYGHSLMATNWAPTTHHGVIATDADGLRWWEDYHAHEHALDPAAATATITGRVEGYPIAYQRHYRFGDLELTVELTLNAEEDVTLERLVECVPIARGGWKARGATLEAAGATEGDVRADRFRVVDDRGVGTEFILDGERDLRLVPEGLQTPGWRQLQIGRVEIELPRQMRAGETVELRYTIVPIPAG